MTKQYLIVALATLGACALQAQNPLSTETKAGYNAIKKNLLAMAEKMPEENYSFKPTPDIRTFGQLVGHIADSQMRGCSAINSEPKQASAASKTSKADLEAALKASFDECDKAYDSLTDDAAVKMIKLGQRESTRLGALMRNVVHDNEEYGYMAVYLRLKGVVPPSSAK
jgi:uncharacterized damage-inducible protein DinB